jgi:SAM-dependent methyltransferase
VAAVGVVTATLPAWDAVAYDANRGHHRAYDAAFLATLPLGPGDGLLDIGCGSGELTTTVAGLVPDGHVVGLDGSGSMIAAASAQALDNQSFVLGPAQRLGELLAGARFDGVYSRAALHWVPRAEWPGVLMAARRLLPDGGWLRIECGGGDNVAAMQGLLDDVSARSGGPVAPWNFLGAGAALEQVEAAGFTADRGWMHTVAQRRPFDREGLLGWLRSQCYQAYGGDEQFRRDVEARVDELRRTDGTYDMTFVRLDLLVYAVSR